MQKLPLALIVFTLLQIIISGCNNNGKSDAYGQFEATKTTISTEIGGKLLRFNVEEGDDLKADQHVGLVDTTRLVLQRDELDARLESIDARIDNINAQVEVQKSELETAQNDLNRIKVLHKDGAATQKQLDDAQARVRTIKKQINALQTQKQSVRAEINAIQAQIAQLEDKIADTQIINPINGKVLTTFVEPYELVQNGQPLYQIASLDTLELRIYISGAQLPSVTLGQSVEVLVDKNAEENQAMGGRISWIASDAEFTPKMIQTKEERVTQVYAVKVKVPNPDGILKIGMPGEVNFQTRN
ncbi:HlyD family secretion protein [Fodinibius sp. Rm-B-1B1-1]|uniref:HlyD family secretion protein n=1 Tax=Fodinibius alkaliphilus TaxID=3140241 RepID=UPI003159E73A